MKKLILTAIAAAVLTGGAFTAQARDHDHDRDRRHHDEDHRHSRDVYVVEHNRPIRRSVFIDERGRYYRENGGRRIFVTRYFNSYPERYYYPDGRRRVGLSIHFD